MKQDTQFARVRLLGAPFCRQRIFWLIEVSNLEIRWDIRSVFLSLGDTTCTSGFLRATRGRRPFQRSAMLGAKRYVPKVGWQSWAAGGPIQEQRDAKQRDCISLRRAARQDLSEIRADPFLANGPIAACGGGSPRADSPSKWPSTHRTFGSAQWG